MSDSSSSSSSPSSSSSSSVIPADLLPADTVFYSHLDGDMSNSRHDVTLNGGMIIGADDGPFNGSYHFDGTGDYLSIPDSDDWDFGSNDWSIDFWVKPKYLNATNDVRIFSFYEDDNNRLGMSSSDSNDLYFLYKSAGSTVFFLKASWTPIVDAWAYICVRRISDSLSIIVNGTDTTISGDSYSGTIQDLSGLLTIGKYIGGGDWYLQGEIAEFRVLKGSDGGWTGSTITVPTEPHEINSYTVLLLHMHGDISDGAHDITTIDGQVIDSGGGATGFNGIYKLDGTNDYLKTTGLEVSGTKDFTFGARMYITSLADTTYLYDFRDAGNTDEAALYVLTNGALTYYSNNNSRIVTAAGVIVAGNDYYIMVVRSSGTTSLYVDGVLKGSGYSDSLDSDATELILGACYGINYFLTGGMDEPLYIIGTALNGTVVPTQPYGTSSSSSSSSSSVSSSSSSSVSLSSSSSIVPVSSECYNCATLACFCEEYVPTAVYAVPPLGGSVDLDNPTYVIPAAARYSMTYSDTLSIAGLTTEGWGTPLDATYHREPRLYFATDLGTWMMTYFQLAIWYEQTSGVYTFHSFVNCIDGCDGLLYVDTCGTHVILLECVKLPSSSSSSSSSSVPGPTNCSSCAGPVNVTVAGYTISEDTDPCSWYGSDDSTYFAGIKCLNDSWLLEMEVVPTYWGHYSKDTGNSPLGDYSLDSCHFGTCPATHTVT